MLNLSTAVSYYGFVAPIVSTFYVTIPDEFTLGTQIAAAVPEPSTWAMLLIGVRGNWLSHLS
jgi:hypothetical protein